jgi:hypothetical protein
MVLALSAWSLSRPRPRPHPRHRDLIHIPIVLGRRYRMTLCLISTRGDSWRAVDTDRTPSTRNLVQPCAPVITYIHSWIVNA